MIALQLVSVSLVPIYIAIYVYTHVAQCNTIPANIKGDMSNMEGGHMANTLSAKTVYFPTIHVVLTTTCVTFLLLHL